jgi:hypothetical protein
MDLQNKKVVFIAPSFFGYDDIIEKALIRHGALVYRMLDRPFSSPLFKAITTLFARPVAKVLDFFYLHKIKKMPLNVDFVLVINGQTLSENILLALRKKNSSAIFVLYMWDSIENRSSIVPNLGLYDKKYSFDRDSAQRYNFHFRPLFYDKIETEGTLNEHGETFLMSFIGTAHSDRYSVISVLADTFSDSHCFWYMYLQAPWVFWWYKLSSFTFRKARESEFEFVPLSIEKMKDVFRRSEIIIDIEHPSQTGLTIRTFDIMRSAKKMVTTNKDIVNYDFFGYGNVFLIDRTNPQIPASFIERKFKPYSDEILDFYSVDGWLRDVLSVG